MNTQINSCSVLSSRNKGKKTIKIISINHRLVVSFHHCMKNSKKSVKQIAEKSSAHCYHCTYIKSTVTTTCIVYTQSCVRSFVRYHVLYWTVYSNRKHKTFGTKPKFLKVFWKKERKFQIEIWKRKIKWNKIHRWSILSHAYHLFDAVLPKKIRTRFVHRIIFRPFFVAQRFWTDFGFMWLSRWLWPVKNWPE